MHIQPHYKRAPSGEEGNPPSALFENQKCPDFGMKDLHCVHLWVKTSIQNVVLRASRRKKL